MPLVALVDGEPALALDPDVTRAQCRDPKCSAPMYRRAGKGLHPHWSHNPGFGERCEVERDVSEWHVAWQLRCEDPGRIEYTQNSRRADVFTRFGWAVEFQHSNLSGETIRGRENAWAGNLVWVHDGTVASAGTPEVDADGRLRWLGAPTRILQIRCLQMVDVGDGTLLVLPPFLRRESGDVVSVQRVWSLTHDEFTAKWLNGATPPAAAHYETRWRKEQSQPPRMGVAPKPRSHKLVEALETARLEHDLGAAEGTCDRVAASTAPPRMAQPRPPCPCGDKHPNPRPCVRCAMPGRNPLAAIPHGYRLCDDHWPMATSEAS